MRKEDIIVTTPKHSTIYAYGTVPESNSSPWEDLNSHGLMNKLYAPAYVLEIKDSGYAIALVADVHPDYLYQGYGDPAATLLEALDYTLEDYNTRQAYMATASHWAEQAERDAYYEGLEALKKLPNKWRVITVRTSYIRMLWAEYVARHEKAIADRKVTADAKRAVEQAEKSGREDVLKDLAKLKIGYKKSDVAQSLRNAYTDKHEVKVPVKVLKRLLKGYYPIKGDQS